MSDPDATAMLPFSSGKEQQSNGGRSIISKKHYGGSNVGLKALQPFLQDMRH